MLRYLGLTGLLSVATVLAVLVTLGWGAATAVAVLAAIEIAFSFDNAVINAKVLERLSSLWQQLFLTVGMVIAILGMRLIFPILIVAVTAHLPWGQVVHEALHHPEAYSRHLDEAHTTIAAFGGGFLLTLALYFLFDNSRDVMWLERIERPLRRSGGKIWLPPLISIIVVGLIALTVGSGNGGEVLRTGLVGVVAYTALKLLIDWLDTLSPREQQVYGGWSAFLAFMYLELLDASFSFDGVLGAFAITNNIVLIAIGLGVGALWVRSLTVAMVRRRTLRIYRYLEHGAHYAILALAAALLASLFFNVPEAVTGIVGLGIIGASLIASRQALIARYSDNRERRD